MPSNDPEYQRNYKQKHYAANRERYKKNASERRKQLRREVNELKAVPCADCGKKYPYYVMDFDHVRGEKVGNIAIMVANNQRKAVFEEISKCDVVCANCHRERSWGQAREVTVEWRQPSKLDLAGSNPVPRS